MKLIKARLERHYPITVHAIQPLRGGHTTDKYRVETDRGLLILRLRNAGFDPRALAADHRFMRYLHAHDLPVPRIVRTRDQGTYVEDQGVLYELQRAIPHDADLDDFDVAAVSNDLFDVLGDFHRVSNTYPETIRKAPYLGDSRVPIGHAEKYFLGPRRYGVPRYRAAAHAMSRGQRAQFEADIRDFLAILDGVEAAFQEKRRTYPVLVNHNDFYGNNILFHEGRISGIVDFDFCRSGPYVIDLVEALHGSMVWHQEARRYLGLTADGDVRVDLARENLRRYFRHNPAFPYDGEFILKFLIAKIISLAWYPAFDFFQSVEEKLEGFRRMKVVIETLDEMHELPLARG